MARRKKTEIEKLLEYLQKTGVDTAQISGVAETVKDLKDLDFVQEAAHQQANNDMRFLAKKARNFMYKKCEECGRIFGTNYRSVAYCTVSCTASAFMKLTGLSWDYTRQAYTRSLEDRWKNWEPPTVVDPDFLETLEFLHQKLIQSGLFSLQNEEPKSDHSDETSLNGHVPQPQPQQKLEDNTNPPPSPVLEFDISQIKAISFSVPQ